MRRVGKYEGGGKGVLETTKPCDLFEKNHKTAQTTKPLEKITQEATRGFQRCTRQPFLDPLYAPSACADVLSS